MAIVLVQQSNVDISNIYDKIGRFKGLCRKQKIINEKLKEENVKNIARHNLFNLTIRDQVKALKQIAYLDGVYSIIQDEELSKGLSNKSSRRFQYIQSVCKDNGLEVKVEKNEIDNFKNDIIGRCKKLIVLLQRTIELEKAVDNNYRTFVGYREMYYLQDLYSKLLECNLVKKAKQL